MGKTLEEIGFAAVEIGVAVFAPELLPATWSALAVSAATAAIEVGVALAANALIGPTLPKGLGTAVANNQGRLFVSMDTTAPRKIVFGITAAANDLRYQIYLDKNSGDQGYYHQLIVLASHQVSSINEIWFDNELAWTFSGGVQGRFVGFLTVDVKTVGVSGAGIPIDSVWTANSSLTGCAYVHLRFDLVGNATDGSNNSPFASGVTSRVTTRTSGALVYDPRLDSTVAGGSGSQRAATQSTWAFDANGSRNLALQLLWYLLGWKINGKLAVGMGLPASRIDLASFAVAANACDESITLNGGGTEPRYRSDGVITEGDDRQSVVEALCATMNAVVRDSGGKLSLYVLHNDLSTPVLPSGRSSFSEADVFGDERWDQTPDLSSTFNICRGRHVDASDTSLYQLVDTPEASLTSNDGIDRIDTMDMPFVSSNGQAQRLLKQRLQRKQYQGKYSFTGSPIWWATSIGDVVPMSHAGLGWSAKLFRVAAQTISRDGTTKMTLIEENAAIYAWTNNETAAVTPGTPTAYNPLNSPAIAKANRAVATAVVIDPPTDAVVYASSTGVIKSGELPKNINLTASIGLFDVTTGGTWSVTAPTGVTCTIGAGTGVLNITALSVSDVQIPVSFTYGGVTRTANQRVTIQDDPPTTGGGGGGGTGGTTGTTTTLGNTTGSSYDAVNAVSGTIQAQAGSNGKVDLSAPISFKRGSTTLNGQTSAIGKWQWRVVGGTWADIGGDSYSASASQTISHTVTVGSINCTNTKTGLTNGTTYEFRFLWASVYVSGTNVDLYYVSGTMTAAGS